jgi:signal transduction histidine kinase
MLEHVDVGTRGPSVSRRSVAEAVINSLVRSRKTATGPWLVLGLALTASVWVFTVVRDTVENVARLQFERQASDINHAIEARIHAYAEIMYGLQALFATGNDISRAQFHRYVASLDLASRFPGYDVVNFARYVPHKDRFLFEEWVRNDTSLRPEGYPNFRIRPAGERPEYFVIEYVEPMEGFEFVFGLDLGANPAVSGMDSTNLTGLQHAARESGKLTASGRPIRIKTRTRDYIGLAVRLAVYKSGVSLATAEDRRAAYLGSVGAGFNVRELIEGALDPQIMQTYSLRIEDVGPLEALAAISPSDQPFTLFESRRSNNHAETIPHARGDRHFSNVLPMRFAGRQWQVTLNAQKDAIIGRFDALLPWLFLIGAMLASGLLAGVFYAIASARNRAVIIATRITEDLRVRERELTASTEQLRTLSRRLVDVEERERKDLARELHDRVGQNLTALAITLDILRTRHLAASDQTVMSRIDDAAALLESTSSVIENVMSDLRPPMLDDYGLLEALRWYANQFSSRTQIEVRVGGDRQTKRLVQASEITLFRIVQEALNNVAKHAHATRVDIEYRRSDAQFTLSVTDNGVGFNPHDVASSPRRLALGMTTMRERAQAIGGEFIVETAHKGGTRLIVRARVPT